MDMKIDFTWRTTIGEGISGCTTSGAQKWATAVGWVWDEGKRVQLVGRMFNVAICIPTVLVEKEVASPTSIYRIVAHHLTSMASKLLPCLNPVEIQIMLMAEMFVFHFFPLSPLFHLCALTYIYKHIYMYTTKAAVDWFKISILWA